MTATNRFAEIPFYMLRDYGTELGTYYENKPTSVTGTELDQMSPVVFTDTKDAEGNSENGYLDGNGTLSRNSTMSSMNNARLYGPGRTIIAEGGAGTKLFVEKESYGYREVAIKPKGESEGIDENGFKFDLIEIDKFATGFGTDKWLLKEAYNDYSSSLVESYDNGGTIVQDIITNGTIETEAAETVNSIDTIKPIDISKSEDSKTFAFKSYNRKNVQFSENAELIPEDTFFFRKDSLFFNWYRKNLKYLGSNSTYYGTRSSIISSNFDQGNHENFLNENLTFTHFGGGLPIHQSDSEWMIQHHSMKNFMINALPQNDLNATNSTFIGETMDRVYEEPYNMSREIQTLLDPEEIPERLLPMLGSFYNVDITNLSTFDDVDIREFVKSLPTLLKKKGTQASLAIIGRALINSKNKVTFFERGHEMFANESITSISLELLENGQPDPGIVKPDGEDGAEGGGTSAKPEQGFPNPLGYIDYAVLYCFDKQIDVNIEIGKSELYLFGDNSLVSITANKYYSTIDYLTTEIQRTKTVVDDITYLIGAPLFEMDIAAEVSEAAHSNGKIKYFALAKRPKQPGDTSENTGGTISIPPDSVPRFLINISELEVYNTSILVEARAAGLLTFEDNFYCELIEFKNENGTFKGKVQLSIFGNSGTSILTFITDEHSGLTHNFVMNHVYNNYFGNTTSSFKLGKIVKTYNTEESLTTYGTVARYNRNNSGINEFIEPENTEIPTVNNDIMYSYNEPSYFIRLSINLETLQNSLLEVGGNSIKVYETIAPKELQAFNEIKYGGQNYVIDLANSDGSRTKFGAGPAGPDRLDDMIGAEMESYYINSNTISYYYKVKKYDYI